MDTTKMGIFIAESRKAKGMTQKELALILGITDKAVSKWERGVSCPDITLLSAVAQELGVTTGELLNGVKIECNSINEEKAEQQVDTVLKYVEKSATSKREFWQKIVGLIFSACLVIAFVICVICNFAIDGTLTWAWYPMVSIIFAWLIITPIIVKGKKGVVLSLLALTVFLLPFLYILDKIISVDTLIMTIGIRMWAIWVSDLWIVFILNRLLKDKNWLASGLIVWLQVPAYMLTCYSMSKILKQPIFNTWDIIDIVGLIGVGTIFIIIQVFSDIISKNRYTK